MMDKRPEVQLDRAYIRGRKRALWVMRRVRHEVSFVDVKGRAVIRRLNRLSDKQKCACDILTAIGSNIYDETVDEVVKVLSAMQGI
jgi:hypothetical protein